MARQRTYSIEFKRQVAQESLGGETLYSLSTCVSVRAFRIRRNIAPC